MHADCHATRLPDRAIDLIFINDAFHEFADKVGCLKEAARILKADGILAIDEHEMKEAKFLGIIEGANLFTLVEKEKRLYKFRPLREDCIWVCTPTNLRYHEGSLMGHFRE